MEFYGEEVRNFIHEIKKEKLECCRTKSVSEEFDKVKRERYDTLTDSVRLHMKEEISNMKNSKNKSPLLFTEELFTILREKRYQQEKGRERKRELELLEATIISLLKKHEKIDPYSLLNILLDRTIRINEEIGLRYAELCRVFEEKDCKSEKIKKELEESFEFKKDDYDAKHLSSAIEWGNTNDRKIVFVTTDGAHILPKRRTIEEKYPIIGITSPFYVLQRIKTS